MDGVSAVASVAGLVTGALQSCQAIYQIISAIRDRSKQISELGNGISSLERVLQQIAKLTESAEQLSRTKDKVVFDSLRPFLNACANDLIKSQARLRKLDDRESNKAQKTWSIAKNVLGSNEFDAAYATINRHMQILSTQLDIAGSQLHLNHGITLSTIEQTATRTYAATRASLSAIRQYDNILGALYDETRELRKDVDRAQQSPLQNSSYLADQLLNKLDTLPSASIQQHDEIIHLLRDVQQQLQSQKPLNQSSASVSGKMYGEDFEELRSNPQLHIKTSYMLKPTDAARTSNGSEAGNTTGPGLSQYINRLCLLSSSKRGTVASDEAESIIDDLESILIEVTRSNPNLGDRSRHSSKRKTSDTGHEPCSSERAIKRFRRALANSRSFEVDRVIPRKASARRTGLKMSYHGSHSYSVEGGTLVISYTARSSSHVQSQEDFVETLDGTLSLLMPHEPHHTKLNVWFSQKLRGLQFDVLPSTVSFQSVRPDESDIFGIASFGTVGKLVSLLEAGRASLSDCDSKGRSLLNYALYRLNVPVCRFLVEHHADVNSLERGLDDENEQMYPPLGQGRGNNFEMELDEYAATMECRKILLTAGSDPTGLEAPSADAPGWTNDAFSTGALHMGTVETIRLYLDHAQHFIDLENRNGMGQTRLLELIKCYAMGHANNKSVPAKTLLLLQRGADIHARDEDHHGCFQTLFCNFQYESSTADRSHHVYNYVTLLLEQGGDVFTPDKWGTSPTMHAVASELGILWFRALANCSLNYDLSCVLAKDHKRWHQWRKIKSSHEDSLHEKPSEQMDTTEPGCETRSAVDQFADCGDHAARFSISSPLHFYQCFDPDCDWEIWDYLEVLSTSPCGHFITDWAIMGHTRQFLSQKTYFCACDLCLFSQLTQGADQKADIDRDPMDFDLEEQESPQALKEDFDLPASLQQKHSYLYGNSESPMASVSEHQSPVSSYNTFLGDMQYGQDQAVQDLLGYSKPTPYVGADPLLCFNPWNSNYAEQ